MSMIRPNIRDGAGSGSHDDRSAGNPVDDGRAAGPVGHMTVERLMLAGVSAPR